MERESNSMQALCRSGCGFYGNPSTDGLCSLCYKEALKKKQQPPGPSPSASTQSAAQAFSAPTSNPVTTAFNTSNAKFMDTAIPTIPVVVNAQASAEKKDNNGRKKLFKSENETRCSSSSSSSNSEDGDVICRKKSSALDAARSSPYPARVLGGAALQGGSEAPTDLVYEYLTRDRRGTAREPTLSADKIRTNLKIVRIRKFQSNESKVLLIVEVPPAVRQQQLEQQQKQQQPPPPHPLAGGAPETPGPSPPLEMGSREIFELSDELAKKFDVDKETSKSFEWRSFSRPDDVIKLLLNDGGGVKCVAAGGPDKQPAQNDGRADKSQTSEKWTVDAAAKIRSSGSIAEGAAPGDEDGRSGLSKPATKRKRVSAADNREPAVATGFERDNRHLHYEGAAIDEAKMRLRSRLVRGLLGKQRYVLNACGPPPKGQAVHPPAAPRTVASTKTTTMPTINKYRDTMVDKTWKILKNCATLRRENVDTLHVLLGEDNAKGVSNCGADTSTSDTNDDALNSSNSDDNDAKAKKKNRCALCRKKVGLTGFECRCGGLYCGMHRYSDKHNCTFDYRQLGAQEIRRNNPVVIGEKIQKI